MICFFHITTNWTLNSQVSGVAIQLRYSQSLRPCKLQKLIPNHESSFCWIYLPLLTLSIIRSSCPHSHHWKSLGFHFTGLNPISLVGLSGWPGEGRYPKHINWSLGFPRDQLQLASSSRNWCLHIEQPQVQHHPTSTHYNESTSPPEVWDLLVSDASWYHHREAQNHSPEHSLYFLNNNNNKINIW